MTGYHKDPRSHIVKRLAEVYGVTESQLRGESPILHGDNVIMINSKAKKINEVVNKMEAMSEEDIDRFLGVINLFGNNNRDK